MAIDKDKKYICLNCGGIFDGKDLEGVDPMHPCIGCHILRLCDLEEYVEEDEHINYKK